MNERKALRKSHLYLAGLTTLAFMLPSCGTRNRQAYVPATFIILIDKSASITAAQRTDYANYLHESVFPSLTPASDVMVETIVGENTHSHPDFRYIAHLPPVTSVVRDATYYILKGDLSVDRQCAAAAQVDIPLFESARSALENKTLQQINSRGVGSATTFLVDGMREASESFERRKGQGILFVLSDGEEDSDEFGPSTQFDSVAFWRTHTPENLVREADPMKTAPGLKGARVYFYGLASKNGNKPYPKIRTFWTDFFKEAGAQSVVVGHGGLDFTEAPFVPTVKKLCGPPS